jgi:branched-chain amino acid transport system permease protein
MSGEDTAAVILAGAPARMANGPGRPLAWLTWTPLLVVALALVPAVGDKFVLSLTTTLLITSIAAASLHLIIRTGHVSLGHAAFVGLGAYTGALLMVAAGLPFPLALIGSFAVPAALAGAIGPFILRLSGKYFVLATFLIGEIVRMAFGDWTSVTGGANGIFSIPAPAAFFADPAAFYELSLLAAVLCVGLVARVLHSELGRAIDSVAQAERLAQSSGMPVVAIKVMTFMLACGLAGVSGAFQACFVHFIDPNSFSAVQSLNLLMINVIGGMTSLVGTLLGAVFIVGLPELLRSYVEVQRILFGVILIVVIAVLPGGLAQLGARLQILLQRLGLGARSGGRR